MTDPASSSPRSAPGLTAALVLVAVALAAGIGGIALDRYVLVKATPEAPRGPSLGGPRPSFGRGAPSDDERRRRSERMAQALGLTPEQQSRVDSIEARRWRGIRRVTAATQPTIDSLTREAQQAMDSVLTPAQQVKIKELRGRGRGRGRPPGSGPSSDGASSRGPSGNGSRDDSSSVKR